MMKSIVALCLIAAAAPLAEKEPMTALQVFEKTQKLYASLEGFTAEVHEETIIRSQSEKAVARLYFKPPAFLRMEYFDEKDPTNITQLLLIDGKMAWTYTPFLNQAVRKKIPESRAKEWLPGVGASFETLPEHYDLALVHDEITAKKNIRRLQIKRKPKEDEPPLPEGESELFDIWIDGKTWLPVQIAYSNPAGLLTVFQLKKMDIKAKPKKSLFEFIPPPDVEIVTIRDEILPDEDGEPAEDSPEE